MENCSKNPERENIEKFYIIYIAVRICEMRISRTYMVIMLQTMNDPCRLEKCYIDVCFFYKKLMPIVLLKRLAQKF